MLQRPCHGRFVTSAIAPVREFPRDDSRNATRRVRSHSGRSGAALPLDPSEWRSYSPKPKLPKRLIGGAVPVRGIGIDVVQVNRIVSSLERFGARFEARLFTDGELAYCRSHKDPLPHLAARFAAKEAAFKAIGTGLSGGVGWKQAEVIQPGGRQPRLEYHGVALERFRALGCDRSHLSIAHDAGVAVACVVIEG
jgi:holo-[acyl-carrier protein] synthase